MFNINQQIRKYAIHKLSTDIVFESPVEKILLARAHKVEAWLDEGLASLVKDDSLKFEDLVTLGWETAAKILWIRETSTFSRNATLNTLHFIRDDIKCAACLSPSSLLTGSYVCPKCRQAVLADTKLTFSGTASSPSGPTTGRLVTLGEIRCYRCGGSPFHSPRISCNSCHGYYGYSDSQVRITPRREAQEMIQEIFGEEMIQESLEEAIEEYELAMTV